MNRHHFYFKKNENDADSRKGLSVRTPEDQGSTVNPIHLVSKNVSAVNKKVQPYRSMTPRRSAQVTNMGSASGEGNDFQSGLQTY